MIAVPSVAPTLPVLGSPVTPFTTGGGKVGGGGVAVPLAALLAVAVEVLGRLTFALVFVLAATVAVSLIASVTDLAILPAILVTDHLVDRGSGALGLILVVVAILSRSLSLPRSPKS